MPGFVDTSSSTSTGGSSSSVAPLRPQVQHQRGFPPNPPPRTIPPDDPDAPPRKRNTVEFSFVTGCSPPVTSLCHDPSPAQASALPVRVPSAQSVSPRCVIFVDRFQVLSLIMTILFRTRVTTLFRTMLLRIELTMLFRISGTMLFTKIENVIKH